MFGNNSNQSDQASTTAAEPAVTTPTTMPDPTPDAALDSSGGGMDLPGSSTAFPASTPLTDPSAAPSTPLTAPSASSTTPVAPIAQDDLLTLKQEALQQLSPLVGHLDQTPEERFRTTMMMIQATDDHTKLKEAYEAAQAIPDEKVRAQALLDVVNEINYFTQHQQQQPKESA